MLRVSAIKLFFDTKERKKARYCDTLTAFEPLDSNCKALKTRAASTLVSRLSRDKGEASPVETRACLFAARQGQDKGRTRQEKSRDKGETRACLGETRVSLALSRPRDKPLSRPSRPVETRASLLSRDEGRDKARCPCLVLPCLVLSCFEATGALVLSLHGKTRAATRQDNFLSCACLETYLQTRPETRLILMPCLALVSRL